MQGILEATIWHLPLMKYNPVKHHRRSIRLKGYDYSLPGAYFVTLCTYCRKCIFGEIVNGMMQLNTVGLCVQAYWQRLSHHFRAVELDAFVVMPNHLHGILLLHADNGRGEEFGSEIVEHSKDFCPNSSPLQPRGTQPGSTEEKDFCPNSSPLQPRGTQPESIGAIVQNFKLVSTRRINRMTGNTGKTVWQRNYYEHVIRNHEALQYPTVHPQQSVVMAVRPVMD